MRDSNTLKILLQKLKQLDETLLMELLEINSEDLVDAFLDKIRDKENWLYAQLEEDFETEE